MLLLAILGLGHMRDEEALLLHPLDDQFARAIHAIAFEAVQSEEFLRHQPVGGLADIGFAIEHVEHVAGGDAGALADLEIVEIMPRGDLHRAAAQLRIGVFVGDDFHAPSGDRQDDFLADHAGVTLVSGMHRHRHIGEHGLGAGGGDDNVVRAAF